MKDGAFCVKIGFYLYPPVTLLMYVFPSSAPRLACGKGRYVQACGPSAGKQGVLQQAWDNINALFFRAE